MEKIEKLLLRSSPSEDTTPEIGAALGHALAIDNKKVVVGTDMMRSSPMMRNALISGLISSGADVIDIGTVSFPVAAYAARMGNCCVYISEFRQPDLVSGFILLTSDGGVYNKEQIRHLEQLCRTNMPLADRNSLGSVKEYYHATEDYNTKLLGLLGPSTGGTIVLNCNCGLATDSAPQILNRIGTDTISLNAQKDDKFASHSLSTKEADIRHMKDLVASDPGSIGISINRIGNMLRVFDESGTPLDDEDVLKILIVFLRPAKVVLPMDVSGSVVSLFEGKYEADVNTNYPKPEQDSMKLILTHPDAGSIHKAMIDNNADLAFFDGGFIFSNICLGFDAIHACLALAQFSGNNNVADVRQSLPKYHSEDKSYSFTCTPEDFTRSLKANLPDIDPKKVYEEGCWRVEMDGGDFFLDFDPESERTVKVHAESYDKLYLISMIEVIDGLIEQCENGQ